MKFARLVTAATLLAAAACSTHTSQPGGEAFVPALQAQSTQAGTSTNAVKDPGFQSSDNSKFWRQCGSVNAQFTSTQSHAGTMSEFGGTTHWPEVNGTAAVCQAVKVPKNGYLQFWVRQDTDDQPKYAWQAAKILDAQGKTILRWLYREAGETNGWKIKGPFNLSAYAGQTVTLQFEVKGTGYDSAFVNQYVDDVALTAGKLAPPPSPSPEPISATTPIKHVIIVLQENRTFDNIFHGYPGSDSATYGLDEAGNKVPLHQAHLMTSWDPAHAVEDWRVEFNNGGMNGFNKEQLDGGTAPYKDFAYTYAMQSDVQPYWDLAKEGVLGDHTFADHRSQSYAGHLYPIAGAAGPIAPHLPDWYVADNPTTGGSCAELGQGEAINIHTGSTSKQYTSCFQFKTMADLLDAKHVSWRYYVDAADKDGQVSGFASIQQVYDGDDWANVVTPQSTFFQDVTDGRLPAVSWVIGPYAFSDHAGQTVPSSNGPLWVTSVFNAVGRSQYWKDSVVILVYDDWGGWYDHVKPVTWNAYEPGFRLPFVVVSPYAKRGYISHDVHYSASILRFIEKDFNLGSLGVTDAKSDALDDVFDFSQAPLKYDPVHVKGRSFQELFEMSLPAHDPQPANPEDRD